jgi:hypothetical protein
MPEAPPLKLLQCRVAPRVKEKIVALADADHRTLAGFMAHVMTEIANTGSYYMGATMTGELDPSSGTKGE